MTTALLLLTLLLAACTSGSHTPIPQLAVTIDGSDANGRTINIVAEGEDIFLNIESNTSWVMEASVDWIEPARLEGYDNGAITLNIGAAEQSRSATILTYLTDYKQIKSSFNIVQHVTPDDQPSDDNTESPEEKPEQDTAEDNTEEDDDSPEKPDDGTTDEDENQPIGAYSKIEKLSQLAAGEYYIGGYQDGVLHLATDGMQVGHCKTTEYTFTENGDLASAKEQSATPVTLEAAAENGYYIHFKDGYLSATAAGAGKLTLTTEKSRYWIFSAHEDGGFVVRQSGEIDVQLIISPKAKDGALLRSVAGDEQGNAIILFRKNE